MQDFRTEAAFRWKHRQRARITHRQGAVLFVTHCPVVQLSEQEALCQSFPDILVQFPEHFNHRLVFRTCCASAESKRKSHLPYLLTVDAWKGLRHISWPALPYPCRCFPVRRIREELLEVIMSNVCASLQDFDSVRLAVCAELFQNGCPSRRWSPFQTRWCPVSCASLDGLCAETSSFQPPDPFPDDDPDTFSEASPV